MYLQSIEVVGLVCFPATVGIAVAGGPLVRTVFGDHWVPAIATMEILALGGPKLALTRLNSSVFQAVGRPRWDFQVGVFDFALFATGFLVGVHFGVAGVATGFAIAAYAALPVDLTVCAKAIGVRTIDIVSAASRVAGATVAMATVGLAVRVGTRGWEPPMQLAGITAAGAATYIGALTVLAPGLFKNTLRRFIRR
jgi:O-antigen/teichoic acid export membrane protein